MPDEIEVLKSRADGLASRLEAHWDDECVEALDEALQDGSKAPSGFGLARAVVQGWIEPAPGLGEYFDAAEQFADEQWGEGDDDDE